MLLRTLTLSALAIALAAAPAMAEHHEKGGHHGKRFERADKNSDGFLTREEMDAAHKEKLDNMFGKLDTDKDGKLSKTELEAGRKEMRAKWQNKMQNDYQSMRDKHTSGDANPAKE